MEHDRLLYTGRRAGGRAPCGMHCCYTVRLCINLLARWRAVRSFDVDALGAESLLLAPTCLFSRVWMDACSSWQNTVSSVIMVISWITVSLVIIISSFGHIL